MWSVPWKIISLIFFSGQEAGRSTFSINKITYFTELGADRKPKHQVTKVCIKEPNILTQDALVTLVLREPGQTENPVQNFEPIKDSIDVAEKCVQFEADKPAADGTVVYSLGVSDGDTVTHEETAKVKFEFKRKYIF